MAESLKWSQFADSKVILFVWNLYQNEYPNHLANIAKYMRETGARLHIVSSTFRTQPYRSQFEESVYLKRLNEMYDARTSCIVPAWDQVHHEKANQNFSRLEETKKINEELYYSILSSWLSRNKTTLTPRDIVKADRKLLMEEVEEYFFWLERAQMLIEEETYDAVIIMNGRHHSNVAVKQVATTKNLKLLYFESGMPKKSKIFLEPFQTQDIPKMNRMFDCLLKDKTKQELEFAKEWASAWCSRNREDRSVNPFIQNNKGDLNKFLEKNSNNSKVIPIFSSSLDERISNLGIPLNGWQSQNQAILEIAQKLREFDYFPIVRIHPNTGWKSWAELLEILKILKTGNVSYVLPWEEVSSYALVDEAPFVITWGSTIALEASACGVPSVNLGRSSFDQLFDVMLINPSILDGWNPKQIDSPNKDKSLLAIYIVNNYGISSEEIPWVENLRKDYKAVKSKARKTQILASNTFSVFRGVINSRPYDIFFVLKRLTGQSIAQYCMFKITNHFLNREYKSSNKN